MITAPQRLLTIGHSYVVGMNRRLAHEIAIQGGGAWRVTAVAPAEFRGDLRRIRAEPIADEASTLVTRPVAFDRSAHLMWYRNLAGLLASGWDVVHCWEEPYVLAGAQIARLTPASARLVVATFQNIHKRYPWPLSAFERETMDRADGWIAFGRTVHDVLSRRPAYAGRPSCVIPPGVDMDRLRPDRPAGQAVRDRMGWSNRDLVVGYLGRFVEQKGLALLMDALRQSTSDWRALFVGGGPMDGQIRRFGDAFPGRVHVATGVGHAEVPAWLNAMTVLCAPSQTTPGWREQFGRMLTEAMACGVPVIASDSGEMPSVVGDAGVVVCERDVAAWTAAIDRVLGNADERRARSAAGVERARAHFSWPVVARAHLAFFDTLMEQPHP